MPIPNQADYALLLDNLNRMDTAFNGDESAEVTTKYGTKYPSYAKAIKTIIQNAMAKATLYATVAELKVATDVSDNAVGLVYNDVFQNNGFYVRKNQEWVKSTFSPAAFDYDTVNIVDTSTTTKDRYIDYQNGDLVGAVGYQVTSYLPVKPSTVYKCSNSYTQQFVFFDKDLKYISGKPYAGATAEFTTPSNAAYVRLTVEDTELATLVVAEKTRFPTAYVPFKPVKTIRDLEINLGQLTGINEVIRESLAIKKINLITPNVTQKSYVDYSSGGIATGINGFVSTDFIKVEPNTEYRISDFYTQQFAFYDGNFTYISGMPNPPATRVFTTPSNAAYVRFTIPDAMVDTLVFAEASIFPDTYVSSDKYMLQDLFIPAATHREITIWVAADNAVNDPKVQFVGNNAIQDALDSITDASPNNRYIIRVKKGLYKITKATDFKGYRGYPAMVLTKDHVDIIGQGKDNTIVWAELPYNDADIGPSIDGQTYDRGRYQTVYDYSGDSLLKDITFVAKNTRYTIHIDNPNGANKERHFDNAQFIFKGNKGSMTAMGCGTSSGEKTYIVGGRSSSDSNAAFASHNNVAFDAPSFWSFKNHEFITLSQPFSIYMQNNGSLVQDQLELIGCSFGGLGYRLGYVDVWLSGKLDYGYDSFNHAEWMITGHGNEPFYFDNTVAGKSLLFKTSAVGTAQNIRFDTTSSAYPIIIKNNQLNSSSSLYVDSREFIDGYIIQDGSIGLPAKAWGCRDLTQTPYLYDNNTVHTSLAKRLGNRSQSPLVLGVLVNGSLQKITFNKDYTSMTNEQILADMQGQVSGVTISLVSYGRDYYPTIPDVSEAVYNNGQTYIPKGTLVTKQAGFVKPASGTDQVYGVALDDIPVMSTNADGMKIGQGRVMKKGYIHLFKSTSFWVLADTENAPIGTRFRVENGSLVTDPAGKIQVSIDNHVVSINC